MAVDMQSIYILASGGSRAMEQLDTSANNIANVNTDGFKKMVIKEMSQRLAENGGDANDLFVFPRFEQSLVQLSQGALKHTGNPLDLSLDGEGFFVVSSKNGPLLTRNGHFFLNDQGVLVDRNGNALLDTQNKQIHLESTENISITPQGTIYQKGEEVAKILVQNAQGIKPLGGGYYQANGAVQKASAKVKQGFLESSNVNPILEMTSLITEQRRFEMYSNMIKSLDQLNQKTNEIGKA